jgi:hypothetical protein
VVAAGDAHPRIRGAERQESGGFPPRLVRRAGLLPRLQRELHNFVRVQRHGHRPLLLAYGLRELGDRQLRPLFAHHVNARRGGQHVWVDGVRVATAGERRQQCIQRRDVDSCSRLSSAGREAGGDAAGGHVASDADGSKQLRQQQLRRCGWRSQRIPARLDLGDRRGHTRLRLRKTIAM